MKKITSICHICMMMVMMTTLWAFSPAAAQADDEAYARLADNTLTFCYNSDKQDSDYNLNTGTSSPVWTSSNIRDKIEKVVFDESFKSYKPTTCRSWFDGLSKLSNLENIENLNTSEVTDMHRMFCGCSSLQPFDATKLVTKKVTSMSCMFYGCTSLSYIALSKFNTTAVTDMSNMFTNCTQLGEINLSQFDTSKVTSMYGMFSGCSSLSKLTMSKLNTSAVVDMSEMFYGCSSLSTIDLSNFDTSKTETMADMFEGCSSLTTLDLSQFNTSKVTRMNYMFANCPKLTTLDLLTFNTAAVTDMDKMFNGCSSLTKILVSPKFTTDKVTTSDAMFSGCTSLVGAISYDATKTSVAYANIETGYFTTEDVAYAHKSGYTLTFYYNNDKQAGDCYVDDKHSWPTADITKVVFDESFKVVKPTTLKGWFQGMTKLKSIEGLEYLNTSDVTDMQYMFGSCENLKSVDVSHFNTEKVTSMKEMFYKCSSLTTLDLSNFNTATVTAFSEMFSQCAALKTIYVSAQFTATSGDKMFYNCSALKGAVAYDANNTGATYANYTTGYFTKKVGSNGTNIIGATGNPLTIEELAITDGNSFALTDACNANSASYTRTMSYKWGTLCLPFAIDATSEDNTCNFYSIDEVGSESITLSKIESGTIAAGTPVLVCKKTDSDKKITIKTSNTSVVTTPVSSDDATCLIGTFEGEVLTSNGYFIAQNKFFKVEDYASQGVKVNPYRAYIKTDDDSSRSAKLSILDGDDIAGINAIDTLNNANTTEYYDATGRHIQTLQHGLNIVKMGNKTLKVIIK